MLNTNGPKVDDKDLEYLEESEVNDEDLYVYLSRMLS